MFKAVNTEEFVLACIVRKLLPEPGLVLLAMRDKGYYFVVILKFLDLQGVGHKYIYFKNRGDTIV